MIIFAVQSTLHVLWLGRRRAERSLGEMLVETSKLAADKGLEQQTKRIGREAMATQPIRRKPLQPLNAIPPLAAMSIDTVIEQPFVLYTVLAAPRLHGFAVCTCMKCLLIKRQLHLTSSTNGYQKT